MPFNIKSANINENWLFEFTHSGGTLRLSYQDYHDGTNFYFGSVTNRVSLRESVNLERSTSQNSNTSVTVMNFTFQGQPLSEFIFGATNNFINRNVTIKSVVNKQTAQTIATFRLARIDLMIDTIQFSLIAHRPWDNVTLPNSKTLRNKYVPIVYGNYTRNSITEFVSTDTPSSATDTTYFADSDFIEDYTSNDYFPAPYYISAGGREEFTTGIHSMSSDAQPAFYDAAVDKFIPLSTPIAANSVRTTNHYVTSCKRHFARGFAYRADGFTDNHTAWTDEADAFDGSTVSYAQLIKTFTSTNGDVFTQSHTDTDITYTFPIPSGELNAGSMVIHFQTISTILNYSSGDIYELKIYVDWTGTGDNFELEVDQSHSSNGTFTNTVVVFENFAEDETLPEQFLIGVNRRIKDDTFDSSNALNATTTVRIKEIGIFVEMINKEKDGLTAYCAGDGLTDSFASGGAAITEIHEAHRDLLIRFAGMTNSTPTGWSTLDAAKDWKIRYWQTKLEDLENILNRLQYEGGFIFRFKRGNSAEPEYIFIKDSYSSGDIDFTITQGDISNVKISTLDFSKLLTKMNVNYDLHPTDSRYLTKKTAFSHTVRNAYNIDTLENIVDVNLNAYVGPDVTEYDNSTLVENANPNNDFFAYYYRIYGQPAIIINADIVNPAFYDIDIGSLVSFSDMHPAKAFGKAYTNVVFMITSLTRSPGLLKVEAREIGAI